MTAKLPDPLTPAGCDLRDFSFMPLDVVRLRDSDLSALESPEACWAAVLLWAASWHQVPAASLPDDDRVLSQFAGYGRVVREWQRVRAGALRGFVACNDGRLYHPVVAEKAREAWEAKQKRMWLTECARVRKLNERNRTNVELPTLLQFKARRLWITSGAADVARDNAQCPIRQGPMSHATKANVACDTDPKTVRQGLQGTGTGISNPLTPLPPSHDPGPPSAVTSGPVGADVTPLAPQWPRAESARSPGVSGMQPLKSVLMGVVG